MRKPIYVICEQQRRKSIQNFKTVASLCSPAGRFEFCLIGNPENRFSSDVAQFIMTHLSFEHISRILPMSKPVQLRFIAISHVYVHRLQSLYHIYTAPILSDKTQWIPTAGQPLSVNGLSEVPRIIQLRFRDSILKIQAPGMLLYHNMSRIVTQPTKWHVRPAKTQISLGISPI